MGELRPREEIMEEGQHPRQVSPSHREVAVGEAGQREGQHGVSTTHALVRWHFMERMVSRSDTTERAIEVKTNIFDLAKKTGEGLRGVGAVRDRERCWDGNGGLGTCGRCWR